MLPTVLAIQTHKSIKLRKLILEAVQRHPADALMLSGGIDSSLLAAVDPYKPAYTAVLKGLGSDLQYARHVASHLSLDWTPIELTHIEALDVLKKLVHITETYDPALLNDIPLYVAMSQAIRNGARVIRTGDFADTLFQGYEYMWSITSVRTYLETLLPNLTLASHRLADKMGVCTVYPYLDPDVIAHGMTFLPEDNLVQIATQEAGDFHVRITNQSPSAKGYTWSKVTLRRAAIGLLPETVVFRTKADLEYGSGTYLLEEELENSISDTDYLRFQEEGYRFWNKMHAAVYAMYRAYNLTPKPPQSASQYTCTWCGGGVVKGRLHCLTCGAYPAV